jgi:thioesterase domain-containing protein
VATRWRAHVDRVVEQIPAGDVVLVGHSAAGRLIPLVAERLDRRTACVFVDAQLPVDVLAPDADEWFLAHVRSIAVDGLLPPWSEWWGDGAWEALVPDPARRAELARRLPRLTLAEVVEESPPPAASLGRAAYLRTSAMFDVQADAAARSDWPVARLDGGHLHLAVDEAEVADALLDLVDQAV